MHSNNNLTLVTALFDIGRGNLESGFRREFDHYLESFSKMLKVNYPMVVYVPPELNDFVMSHRSPENTRIVNRTLDDLKNFPFYKQIQEIRQKPEWIHQSAWIVDSTQAKLELYNPLVMSKQFFLNDATHFNHFNTKYFVWVDAGLSNTIGNPEHYFDADFEQKIIPLLDNKMLYVAFPYDENAPEVHGFVKPKLDQIAGAKTQHVCRGGLFGGNKDSINFVNDVYYQLLNSTLNAGYMGTEESIFTIISYLHKDKVNLGMIEGNGLIYKFLRDLKQSALPKVREFPFAWYFLTFNTPEQFEFTIGKWKRAYPNDFNKVKKYVVNNSNDPTVEGAYSKLFADNNIEVIHSGENLGICSGREFIAEHFDTADHDYYIFIEEDMGVYEKGVDPEHCKNGFLTHDDYLFDKVVHIMEGEKLDFLRLTFTEFFGDCMVSWSYINNPQIKKDLFYPPQEGLLPSKDYCPTTLNKPKIDYLGVYKGLPYAVGNFHYSNWPVVFNKEGNKKVFLDIKWAHQYEQTWMSNVGYLWEDKKIKIGCLLASPILHNRMYHYDGSKRRENKNYTN